MGVFLLTHAANLAIIEAGRVTGRLFPPVLGEGKPPDQLVDPLPQALILTAIVIGFGVLAFSLVLAHRVHQSRGTDDVDEIGRAEQA